MNLTGRVAIVTGGAQGFGRATVEAFVEADALGVIIADMQADQAQSTAQEIMGKWSPCPPMCAIPRKLKRWFKLQ